MASLISHTQTGLDDVTAKVSFLKNPDLMAMTLSHLPVKKDERRRCLLNAALTCRDFLDEALDALWENLDSMVPLLKLLPALQVVDEAYVLSGNVSQADWDRLLYYSRKVKFFEAMSDNDNPGVHSSTYFRIAQLQSSALFPSLRRLRYDLFESSIHIFLFLSPLLDSLELFSIRGCEDTVVGSFLATLSSPMLSRIVLHAGEISVDILKNSIFHFKHLRSLGLLDAVYMRDFALLEVLGTLPSLADFTLNAVDPYPARAPEHSSSRSGSPRYFVALESLCVSGSFFLIQHTLGFIDSPWLKSIEVYPTINHDYDDHVPEELFTPSMTIIASKWSQSLKNLLIHSSFSGIEHHNPISKCLMLIKDLHEIQSFHLMGWRMENVDDDMRRLVMLWPKIRVLNLEQIIFSLSTFKIIAENYPELRYLHIQLDISTFPPFDASSKRLSHNLEVLTVARIHRLALFSTPVPAGYDVGLVLRHLDLIFPYLKSIEICDETWSELDIRNVIEHYKPEDGRQVE